MKRLQNKIILSVLFILLIVNTCSVSLPLLSEEGGHLIPSDEHQSMFSFDQDVIIYTANQGFFSRIYILDLNGSVLNYFEYENFRFCDTEIVNHELYVAEAFAPRVEKVNLQTGELDVIVDDWSLFYFYDLAYDGMFFYVDEWDLNRYFINGVKDGVASFDETVFGSAWDGSYLWMLTENNSITCWDVANWPNITEVVENSFIPPSPQCRGLWFDGQYFWTAESLESSLGYIYQFNYSGDVINQWVEPAYSGWSACLLKASNESIDIQQTVFNRGFPIRHAIDGDWAAAQSFVPTVNTMTKAEIYLRKFGSPSFNLTVELRTDDPQGTVIDSEVFTPDQMGSSWQWVEIDFTDTTITPGLDYFIVIPPAPSGVTTSFGYEWGYAFGDQYADGSFWFTRDGGALWRDLPSMYEFAFRTFGYN